MSCRLPSRRRLPQGLPPRSQPRCPRRDRSASPDLKPATPPVRPPSPNILRFAAAAKESRPVANGTLYIQHGGISAGACSPTRPLVFVGAVTSSAEIASALSGRTARRLSNPRLAAETAARAAAGTGAGDSQAWTPSHADGQNTAPATVQLLRASIEPARLKGATDTEKRDVPLGGTRTQSATLSRRQQSAASRGQQPWPRDQHHPMSMRRYRCLLASVNVRSAT